LRHSFTPPIALRPDWASAKDDDAEAENGKACVMKVVMAGSGYDGPDLQPHIRNTPRTFWKRR
jgi:type I restriction enzyme R subunit